MTERDVDALRAVGLDDRAIVDANQVVAYFNYVNRVADGLGVELEPPWPPELRRRRGYGATVRADELPWLTVEQMRALDRVAVEELGVTLERMMENAGRNLARLARLLGGRQPRSVAVLAGSGGNGGGGLVAARHLASAGIAVTVVLASPPERLAPVTREQYEIVRAIGIPVAVGASGLGDVELVLDALLGYSQAGAPEGETAAVIAAAAGRRVLALDVPSGLELSTGKLHEPHVHAEATLTLAAPKRALRSPDGLRATGELFLGDISIPAVAYGRVGIDYATPFSAEAIVRISDTAAAG